MENLVKNLSKDDLKYLNQEFGNKAFNLVEGKWFFIYEFLTDFENFKEEFPSKEKFYSYLTGRKFTDKEHEHVINVELKTMRDSHDFYFKHDLLLLVVVYEKLGNNSLQNYGLCPSHYLNAPRWTWDTMLKITKNQLELIPDPDMYTFFEKGTIGGISYIRNRCSKTNNKHLKSYDLNQESKLNIYIDTNNLYGYVVSQFLPRSGFKWIEQK